MVYFFRLLCILEKSLNMVKMMTTEVGEVITKDAIEDNVDLEEIILKKYQYNDLSVSYFTKNNFLTDLEEYRDQKQKNWHYSLTKMQWMLIQTSFYMAHQLRQVNKKKVNFDAETEFTITLDQFGQLWDIAEFKEKKENGSIYNEIQRALISLRKRSLSYPSFNGEGTVNSGYFQYVIFNEGEFTFGFPKTMIPYIQTLGNKTWYYFENMVLLKENVTASILFEQFSKNKYLKGRDDEGNLVVDFELEKLKKLLSPKAYDTTYDFKRYILNPTIDFINSKTTMKINKYEQIKSGKSITGFKFYVQIDLKDYLYKKAIENTKLLEPFMNDSQRLKFAYLLIEMSEFSEKFNKENLDEMKFFDYIRDELSDNSRIIKDFYPFLKKLKFSNKLLDKSRAKLEQDMKKLSNDGKEESNTGSVKSSNDEDNSLPF